MENKIIVDYSEQYSDPEDRYIAALADVRRYIGEDMWKNFTETYYLRETDKKVFDLSKIENRRIIRTQIRNVCEMFWGVRGFPVRALIKFIFRTHINRARNRRV